MNIFQTSLDPFEAADWLCVEHLAKMPLESAQLISTVIHHMSGLDTTLIERMGFYKPTHVKHPSTLWLKHSRANFIWLIDHMKGMNRIYDKLSRSHKSFAITYIAEDLVMSMDFPNESLTPIYLAMADEEYGDIKHKYAGLQPSLLWKPKSLEAGVMAYQEYVRRKTFKPVTKKDREQNRLRLPTWIGKPPEWYIPSCTL